MATLRILFDENIICEDNLGSHVVNGEVHGYKLKTWPFYYHNLPVSSVKNFEVKVDGKIVDKSMITFQLENKLFTLLQLTELYTKYWYFIDKAELIIKMPRFLVNDECKIDLKLKLNKSYSPSAPLNYNSFGAAV
jgi:hypothetical protein